MGRILVVWCALSIACGSDKGTNEQLAAAPASTELAAPTPVEAAPPVAEPPPTPQELEREAQAVRCRRGEVEACATAATLSAGLGDQAGARALHELGCLHGSAAACGALVEVSEFWLGAACRRGDKEACRNASAPRASKFRLTAPKKGPVGKRVRATYAASIEDCAVRHDTSESQISARFSVREGHTADIVTTPATGALATCVRDAIARWVFLEAGADGGPHEVSARFQTARAVASAELKEEAARAIAVLLADTGGGDQAMGELGTRADLGNDLEKQLDEIKKGGARTTVRGGATRGGSPATADGPADDPKKSGEVTLRIMFRDVDVSDESAMTTFDLTAKIKRQYAAGLQRCHKQRLKVDPDYVGTVRLSFTIQEVGRTTNARADAAPPAADLADCVRSMVGSWRFSTPRDEDGEPTDVDVSLRLMFEAS